MIAGTRGRARKRPPAPAFRRGNSGARLPKRGEGRVSGRQLSPSGAGILPRDRRKQGKRARDETPSRAFCALARPPSKRRTERFPACRVPDKTKRGGGNAPRPPGSGQDERVGGNASCPPGSGQDETRRGRFRPDPPPPRLGKAGDPSRRSVRQGCRAGTRVGPRTANGALPRLPGSGQDETPPRLPGSRFLPNTSLRPPSKRRRKRFPARRVSGKTNAAGEVPSGAFSAAPRKSGRPFAAFPIRQGRRAGTRVCRARQSA